jgi:hypothetical protein
MGTRAPDIFASLEVHTRRVYDNLKNWRVALATLCVIFGNLGTYA